MQKLFLVTTFIFISLNAFSQFQVGKTKAEIKAETDKVTPKRIGMKLTALTADYELYTVGDNVEFLRYITKGGFNSEIHEKINFTSLQEESDFYKYVVGLYDDFKDNEVILNQYKIVPHEMKLLGMKNIMFDVYPNKDSKTKYSTIMISKKAWIRLFSASAIHSL